MSKIIYAILQWDGPQGFINSVNNYLECFPVLTIFDIVDNQWKVKGSYYPERLLRY